MAEITWIKLKTDMFDDEKIKLIERMPEGDGILIIWVKLLAYAGKVNCSGYIMIAEDIPMNVEEMAIIFNRPFEKVRYAIQVLQRYKMVEVDEQERVCITNWEKHQNIDGMEHVKKLNAERQKKHREKKKLAQLAAPIEESNVTNNVTGHVTVTPSHATDKDIDLDKDSDIDKETDKDIDKKDVGQSSVNPLIDSNFLTIKTAFEQSIRIATIQDCNQINEALEFYESALILQAIEAGKNGRSFRYVLGILDNWRKELGVKTYQDWQQKLQKGGNGHAANRSDAGGTSGKTPEERAFFKNLRNFGTGRG